MDGVIDLHCHVLPGIDDGPDTIEQSVALARQAADGGTRTIVATPHVNSTYANDHATIAALVQALNARLREERVELEIRAGAEIAITRVAELDRDELASLGLGGSGWLLIEYPFTPFAPGLDAVVRRLQAGGQGVLLAHPERCGAFQRDPQLLESLVAGGALASITAGSLVGRFGRGVRDFALRLLRDGVAHNVASDAHDTVGRPAGIAEEIAAAGLAPLSDWLTRAVPDAILANADSIPPRPEFDAHASSSRLGEAVHRRRRRFRRAS